MTEQVNEAGMDTGEQEGEAMETEQNAPPEMTLSNWPDTSPHWESRRILSIHCGNSRFHWALHDSHEAGFLPLLFWKTTLIDTDAPLVKYLPKKAIGMLFNGSQDHSVESLIREHTASRIPFFYVYVISTNEEREVAIPNLFRDLPCRVIKMQTKDFLTKSLYKEGQLGVDRAANMRAAGQLFGYPVMVIDGGTALTWTASGLDETIIGGGIAPGLAMKFSGLHERTSTLPLMESQMVREIVHRAKSERKPIPTFSVDTEHGMVAGCLRETALNLNSVVEAWMKKLKKSSKDTVKFTVVVTGGDSEILEFLMSPQYSFVLEDHSQNGDKVKPYEVNRQKNLAQHGIAQIIFEQCQTEENMTDMEKKRSLLLGQRIIHGEEGSQRRGTIYEIVPGEKESSLAEDTFYVRYDDLGKDKLKAEATYVGLLEFHRLGDVSENVQRNDKSSRKLKMEEANKAAGVLAEYLNSGRAQQHKRAMDEAAQASSKKAKTSNAPPPSPQDLRDIALGKSVGSASAKTTVAENGGEKNTKEAEASKEATEKVPDSSKTNEKAVSEAVEDEAPAAAKEKAAADEPVAEKEKAAADEPVAEKENGNSRDADVETSESAEKTTTNEQSADDGGDSKTPDSRKSTGDSKSKKMEKSGESGGKQKSRKSTQPKKFGISQKAIRDDPAACVGKRVAKYFGSEAFFGSVRQFLRPEKKAHASDPKKFLWHIRYDDGDEEDYDITEMVQHMKEYELLKHADKDD